MSPASSLRAYVLLAATGCGRLAFDPIVPGGSGSGDDANDDARGDVTGVAIDACASTTAPPGCMTHGVPVAGTPEHTARVWLTAMNAVRADPSGFRAEYLNFGDASGANVLTGAALPMSQERALSHDGGQLYADDRITCPGTAITSSLCDGTPLATWGAPYAPVSRVAFDVALETIFAPDFPMLAFGELVCSSGVHDVGYLLTNCPDDSARGFLLGAYPTAGVGAADATAPLAATMLVNSSEPAAFAFPIPSATHWIYKNAIHFLLDVDVGTDAPPQAAFLELDAQHLAMPLALGTASRGVYRITQPVGSGCRSYHFTLVDGSGQTWRYPAAGRLRTTREGGCTEESIP